MWYDSILIFTIPTTIVIYLVPFAYSILQLTRNPDKPPNTVGVYSKPLPFVFSYCYLLLSTYMMSVSFVSFLLILSIFVSSTLILNSWESILFPRKVDQSRLILPTDCNKTKDFLPKPTKLVPGRPGYFSRHRDVMLDYQC